MIEKNILSGNNEFPENGVPMEQVLFLLGHISMDRLIDPKKFEEYLNKANEILPEIKLQNPEAGKMLEDAINKIGI